MGRWRGCWSVARYGGHRLCRADRPEMVRKQLRTRATGLFDTLRPEIHIRLLERLKLGTTYPQQVEHVANLMERPSLAVHRPYACIDYTGVGRPVFDMFGAQKLVHRVQGITITGGRETLTTDVGWSVPKGELVSLLQAKLHSGNLKVAKALPDAAVLLRELQDFRVRFTDAGNATFNAREGAHDDLVLAVALAVFGLSRPQWATQIKMVWPH